MATKDKIVNLEDLKVLSDHVEGEVTDLKSDIDYINSKVFKTTTETESASFSIEVGQHIDADTPILNFRVPANTTFAWKVEYGSGVSDIAAVYKTDVNETRSVLRYSPTSGVEYTATSSTEIAVFSVYITKNSVTADTTITLTVSYSIENDNSMEEQVERVPVIEEKLKTEVFSPQENTISDATINISAGSAVSATPISVNFSAGTRFKFKVNDPNHCITQFYVYYNNQSDYNNLYPNYEYIQTAEQNITSIHIYVASDFAVSSGSISFVVTELVDHPSSIEYRLDELSDMADYVPSGVIDGYTVGRVTENGVVYTRGYLETGTPNRIRTSLIPIKTGDKIVIDSGSFQYACRMWKGTPSTQTIKRADSDFRDGDETINVEYNGYTAICFRKEDDSNISANDFDGIIKLYNTLAYHTATATSLNTVEIPDYYKADDYLENKVARINALGGASDDVFVFITDVHWEKNAKHSPALINYLSNSCKIPRMFDGGDVADTIMPEALRAYRKNFDGHIYRLCGNHDWFAPATGESLYYWFNSENNDQIGEPFEHYWYTDNVQQKIRYITLNSFKHTGADALTGWDYEFDINQIEWFSNEALNVPTGFDVIVFVHYLRNASGGETGYASIESAIANFNANTENHGKVLCVFQGHTHCDAVFHTSSGVPVITTTCDKYEPWIDNGTDREPWLTSNREEGTTSEQAFDVVILNRDSKYFNAVRIGAKAMNNFSTGHDETFSPSSVLDERIVHYEKVTVSTTETLSPTIDGTITWFSADPSIATINNGTVSAVANGTVCVSATNASGQSEVWIVECYD